MAPRLSDDLRKRNRGTRDPSPRGAGVIPVDTSSPSSKDADKTYNHFGRKKNGKSRRSGNNLASRMALKFRRAGSPAVIGLAVVILGTVLACLLVSFVIEYFSSVDHKPCNESHINGIEGNIYNWCYKNKLEHSKSLPSQFSRSLGQTGRAVKRVFLDRDPKTKEEMVELINNHERLSQEIVSEDQNDLCYADLARYGTDPDQEEYYHKAAIGPCHYDEELSRKPRAGSYEDYIDYYFFRDSEDGKYTDKLQCLNECIDRLLVSEHKKPKHGGHFHKRDNSHTYNLHQEPNEVGLNEITSNDKLPVDDIMLIEAAQTGMTFVAEKLFLEHGLDPLYRQVINDPSTTRNLNAIQEAIRGGYAEIVGILTSGDNSMVIDEYGRTVEDYVQMKGSPIRPVDAKNVLGITVDQGSYKLPKSPKLHKPSGWSETSKDPFDKTRCDIDVVDGDLDSEVFFKDYFMTGRPVILRGQVSQDELDTFSKKKWKKNQEFNLEHTFEVGPTAYPALTDQESCRLGMTIKEMEEGAVCAEMPEKPMVHAFHPDDDQLKELYPKFYGNILDKNGGFRSIQQYFKFVEDYSDLNWQVFFGGDGSGATYHWHEAAFNILYVGVKEWNIAPPLYRGFAGMTAQKVTTSLDEQISLKCIQHPGDLIYVPNFWGHNTINHGFTIGAAGILGTHYQNGYTSFRGDKIGGDHDEEEEGNEEEEEEEEDEDENPPFLFVHINKTGGTSLIAMFNERCEDEYWGGEWYDENGDYHRDFHATAHAYIEHYGRKAWDDAYTFSIVRHPLARQVSNFFFLLGMGCVENKHFCDERLIPDVKLDSLSDEEKIAAFHVWIKKLYKKFPPGNTEHYRFGAAGHGNEVYDTFGASQTSWMVDPDGNRVVKDMYKLEDLSTDISTLAKNIPCLKKGPLELAKKNKTSKYPDFMLFAEDEETKKIINEVFADDFKNLGYDPL
eukprot:CAMPEP_0116110366 /NCGR_PEP_ID=MMETSP0327-20121206/17864_1 /TAXON_ID=44447 /ORGANISM="Pseudo-nitzschia delicatissima, Strain B596" /LENGTH=950 /DNA_ID=CAMNT_0003603507 /DNA_START=7 /DNA_END=2859 /DNA_ORIENTATION=+